MKHITSYEKNNILRDDLEIILIEVYNLLIYPVYADTTGWTFYFLGYTVSLLKKYKKKNVWVMKKSLPNTLFFPSKEMMSLLRSHVIYSIWLRF